ncbi:hypothetical protein BZG36_00328 [Bifiguratus adelaidae]|uniref:Arb2 domain-containing protein n=1 Tax=Bifiguratus adelaidae TaxID=1938954 RepID=A0A261Y7W8_9FUNG|nr:hypothetical protein BZG36_00328 [Bifiguratus adelaidae]
MGNTTSSERRVFPDTLSGFGYHLNAQGQLRHVDTGKFTHQPFEYEVKKGDREYNQAHYEALADVVSTIVENDLTNKYNLKRQTIPLLQDLTRHRLDASLRMTVDPDDQDMTGAKSHIYLSSDALSNTEGLVILIQGSGAVRPGQWARSVIINDSLQMGSMGPFIDEAKQRGWAVLIANPNRNDVDHADQQGRREFIPGSESPEAHVSYIWDAFESSG